MPRVCSRWLLAPFFVLPIACTNPPVGQLQLVVSSDVTAPDDLDNVLVEVESGGQLRQSRIDSTVGPNQLTLPGTLGIVAGDSEDPAVIRVFGKRGNEWRALREAVVSVPADGQIVALHLPLQWLCLGEASVAPGSARTMDPLSACPSGETCASSDVALEELPAFSDEEVYGGTITEDAAGEPAECFDTLACFAGSGGDRATGIQVDEYDSGACELDIPVGDQTNVALVVPRGAGGFCPEDADAPCLVPLDFDAVNGWRDADGKVRLPEAVCRRVSDGDVLGIAHSNACDTKTRSNPPCGDWSSVAGDATTDAATPVGVVDLRTDDEIQRADL
jgi:hypothetical protein